MNELHCGSCREAQEVFPFTMAFQPVVDLREGRIEAYEALVRGPSGESAYHVLGQVTKDNLYSFDQACRVKAIELAARFGLDRRLNINFLPNAVYQPAACIRLTLDAAKRFNFPLDQLTFEIVEGEHIAKHEHLKAIITEYRRHGFKIALDDFGTGYSGLARLAELRPDIVKLDRALIQDCDHDQTKLAIVAAVVALGRAIDVKVVVEGIEREGEWFALRETGVRFAQGFLFAKPKFEGIVRDSEIPMLQKATNMGWVSAV